MIKLYRKDKLLDRNHPAINHNSLNIEFQVLSRALETDFIGSLSHCFISNERYYLVMPFYGGGNLKLVMKNSMTGSGTGRLSEELVRFYTV